MGLTEYDGPIGYEWRGKATNAELRGLHSRAFDGPSRDAWTDRLQRRSLGWVTARDQTALVGFVNVISDGGAHAVILDTMVAPEVQRHGIGTELIKISVRNARKAGCRWLHVDSEESAWTFYERCGFQTTSAGLIDLQRTL